MSTYKKAGVDVSLGDTSSKIAYKYAKMTFPSRKGMIGRPFNIEGGFSGALDMGGYYLVHNCDGVGTKIEVARLMGKYDTLGYDLLAMVTDDAVCLGAEVISMVNTIDTGNVEPKAISSMMKGLSKACHEQHIVIPGGEIAELPSLVHGMTWNAACVGIVEKEKLITGKNIRKNDVMVGLLSRGFRSNGFTLIRYILEEKFGPNWYKKSLNDERSWGEVVLTPSLIYHRCVLEMIGGYQKKRLVDIHGIVHVTGGGIYNNTSRILRNHKAVFSSLPKPHDAMLRLMDIGKVSEKEAYKTWNMGVGMVLICPEKDAKMIESIASKHGIKSKIIGYIASL